MKPLKQLGMQGRAEFARQTWFAVIEPGTTIADVLNPQYWVHQGLLVRHDLIELVAADGSLDVLLRVADLHGKVPVLRILRAYVAEAEQLPAGDVVELVPGQGWRALAGGELVAEGLDSRAAAEAALKDFRAGVAA